MSIRWRLSVLGIQLLVLIVATKVVTGHLAVEDPWFIAGLLAVVINPQLIETPYARPGHVVANAAIFLFLYWVAHKSSTQLGWNIAAVTFSAAAALAVFGVTLSNLAARSRASAFARAARQMSQIATGEVVFSTVFFLDLLNYRPISTPDFWILTGAWALLILLAHIDWQRMWLTVSIGEPTCMVESLTGPSVLTVTAGHLPAQGTWVDIRSSSVSTNGIMLRRILRKDDVWGQIHVVNEKACEQLLADRALDIQEQENDTAELVGSVDVGSTDNTLRFIATTPLEIGTVVLVPIAGTDDKIIYQLASAAIEDTDIKGGAHLFVRALAAQIGRFVTTQQTFRRHLWVPSPGAPVLSGNKNLQVPTGGAPLADWELLGSVIGTSLPIYLDLSAASEGHVAILGMTKMGKSTLAERLAKRLAANRAVVICDLTGEYVTKKGFAKYAGQEQLKTPGVCVFEPAPGEVPAEKALNFLRLILDKLASPEYLAGNPFPRTLIIDEAHQFIPEPAGIGFNAPGRDASYGIGLLMMQIRKYGISVILISQRTAVVAKSALSQCENLIAFRSVDQTGLDYLEAVAGGEVRLLLPRLKQRQALAFGPAISSDTPVAIDVA